MRGYLCILIVVALQACSIKLVQPLHNYPNSPLKLSWNDTLVFRLPYRQPIDSVILIGIQEAEFKTNVQGNTVHLVADTLLLGGYELDFYAYLQNGKKKRIKQSLYFISDIEPLVIEPKDYRIIPHDTTAYTQGLIVHNNQLFESTGLVGQSKLHIINIKSGEIVKTVAIDTTFFGEGIAWYENDIWQLTWKDGIIQTYTDELNLVNQKPYHYEGWGLTTYGSYIVASDGTEELRFLNPRSLSVEKSLFVYDHIGTVSNLNELEVINGQIWANVYGRDVVMVIGVNTGKVLYHIDLSKCIDRQLHPYAGVCNGIAYNSDEHLVYFTGKNWPYIIEWKLDNQFTSEVRK